MPDLGQRFLSRQRESILEHLSGNEPGGIGQILSDVEANHASHRPTGVDDGRECSAQFNR